MATEKQNTAEKTAVAAPVEERVPVFVPRGRPEEDPNLFISINGINYVLPRGKTSMVPPHVAKEIERSRRATDAYYDEMSRRAQLG